MRVTLTYLEFYSGIGGWGYAVEHACRSIVKEVVASSPPATHPSVLSKAGNAEGDNLDLVDNFHLQSRLLAAYDHSDLANSVFYHNHSTKSNDGSFVGASSSSSLSSSLSSPDRGNSKTSRKKKKTKRIHSNDGQCNNRPRQTPIERLTVEELQSHSADIWCMSPPCQPHTRQHSNQHKESEDTRSKSFLHLCKLLCDMEENTLPKLILLENVIGFEKEQRSCNDDGSRSRNNSEDCQRDASLEQNGSDQRKSPPIEVHSLSSGDQECADGAIGSFQSFRHALSRRNYHVGHFHLDPTHVGIPNNRPRHYTVAFRQWQQNRPDLGGKEAEDAPASGETSAQPFTNRLQHKPPDGETTRQPPLFQDNNGKRRYDHLFNQELQLDKPPIIHNENALHEEKRLPPLSSLSSFLDNDLPPHIEAAPALSEKHKSLQIPEKVHASSSAWCFDIATPNNNCITSCFTHSYGKFVRGTGSILYTGPPLLLEGKYNISDSADSSANHRFQLKSPEERVFDATWSNDLDWDNHLRYFSGTEIARLMGFPVSETPGTAPCKDVVNAESAAKTGAGDTSTVDSEESSFRKFSFQPECTMKQQWKLLGNSLNVRVAAIVAEIGVQSILDDLQTDTILKETN
ncbi:hypothetical protein ACHAXH_008619 [Discostella pseudostelligera]